MGSSGILCLGDVIIADMVPLSERGLYTGLLSMVFVVAAAIGPLIGGTCLHCLIVILKLTPYVGVLASRASWRWLFCRSRLFNRVAFGVVTVNVPDINLPLCGMAFVQCMIFLRLKSRILTWREKLAEMDFMSVYPS
jgi:hypothetical protein